MIAVKRVDLSPDDPKRKALAIADNRAGDLSTFDEEGLAKLMEECGELAKKVGFNAAELKQMALAISEDTEKPIDPDTPEVPFTEELLEKHNYIVLYFDNDIDWLQAITLFDIHPVHARPSKPGFIKTGVGRVIRGADALNRLLGGAR